MPGDVGLGCVVGSIEAEQNRLRRAFVVETLRQQRRSFSLAAAAEVCLANVIPVCLLVGKWNKKILFKGVGVVGAGRGGKLSAPYRAYTVPAYIKNWSDCTLLFMAIKSSRLGPRFRTRALAPTKTGNESEDEKGDWFEKKGGKKKPSKTDRVLYK